MGILPFPRPPAILATFDRGGQVFGKNDEEQHQCSLVKIVQILSIFLRCQMPTLLCLVGNPSADIHADCDTCDFDLIRVILIRVW
jgi:hypothetical protein